nr:N-acetylglucosamine kinase [uncultured Gellertiella sp.]
MSEFILGIDGGGSTCRAAVATLSGAVLARGESGPANILSDPQLAIRHITEAALAAVTSAGIGPELIETIPALLGLAGSTVPRVVEQVLPQLPFCRSVIESDGLIALQGALGDEDGSVAILGTGTIYYLRFKGEIRTIGGWGSILGDFGSGCWIGRAALQESLLSHDGIRPQSRLTASLMAHFGDDPARMVDFARGATPRDFAGHAPQVFQHADEGDAIAISLLRQAGELVDAALDRLVGLGGAQSLCLLGGIAGPLRPWLAERHRARLRPPVADALTGAVELARMRFAGQKGEVA